MLKGGSPRAFLIQFKQHQSQQTKFVKAQERESWQEGKISMKIITCEQVSGGHPDKICDQIADAIVTDVLQNDKNARVAIEVLIKDRVVVIAGELTSKHNPNYPKLVRDVFENIGFEKLGYFYPLCVGPEIQLLVNQQSPDIALGVDKGGAGDRKSVV